MSLKTTAEVWGSAAKFLHWTIAIMVIMMMVGGNVMKDLPNNPDKMWVYSIHKSMGLTILALMLLRLLWRAFDPRPADPPGLGSAARFTSRAVHMMFYVLLIAMPISGWLYNSASNFPLKWFGFFSVPALSGPDKDLKHFALETHETLFWIILVVLALHAAAALKHHLIDRDSVLRRMLPFVRIRSGDPR
jgi:cytochrome b561